MLQQMPITVPAWALETQETTSESNDFLRRKQV
jgi:hypothetical protein